MRPCLRDTAAFSAYVDVARHAAACDRAAAKLYPACVTRHGNRLPYFKANQGMAPWAKLRRGVAIVAHVVLTGTALSSVDDMAGAGAGTGMDRALSCNRVFAHVTDAKGPRQRTILVRVWNHPPTTTTGTTTTPPTLALVIAVSVSTSASVSGEKWVAHRAAPPLHPAASQLLSLVSCLKAAAQVDNRAECEVGELVPTVVDLLSGHTQRSPSYESSRVWLYLASQHH